MKTSVTKGGMANGEQAPQPRGSGWRWGLLGTLMALSLVAIAWLVLQPWPTAQTGPMAVEGGYRYVPGRAVEFGALTDHHGRPFVLDQWRGRWLAVNFGYLSCPDVCPLTLNIFNRVLAQPEQLPLSEPLVVLYPTVDPARDTPERLKEFLGYFDPAYLGLTGSEADLTALARQLNVVFISQKKGPEDLQYTVSHSSSVALINPEGRFVAMLKGPDSAEQLLKFLQEALTSG